MNPFHPAPRYAHRTLVAFATCLALCGAGAIARSAPPIPGDEEGVEVLTRGPVHEAFAGVVEFNPAPGVEVPKAPPPAIEELPPDERPEGINVTWIPGYWSWDDERNDFLWVSGVWRALPPGRQWVAGYWAQSRQGFQWISGYWADARVNETTYLPPPPATVEAGPNIAAPSVNYGWTPGCWVWYQSRYAWRPGYWVDGRADWVWYPAYYVWTPRGYVFVEGYWDYPVYRRGVLFAPVYFGHGVYARHGYHYSPRIVINLTLFVDHLFLRPRYHHYYYGDYYSASYASGGFYASFSYQSTHRGYDPIYAHRRWEHRQDRDWEHRVQVTYQNRRDHEEARPPRTWSAQRKLGSTAPKDGSRLVAMPYEQLSKEKGGPVKFQPVAPEEKQQIIERGKKVQKFREERSTLEVPAVKPSVAPPGKPSSPSKVTLPQSPIVAKPPGLLNRDRTPPKPHKPPTPDLKVKPKDEDAAMEQSRKPVISQPEGESPDNSGTNTVNKTRGNKDHPKKDQE